MRVIVFKPGRLNSGKRGHWLETVMHYRIISLHPEMISRNSHVLYGLELACSFLPQLSLFTMIRHYLPLTSLTVVYSYLSLGLFPY